MAYQSELGFGTDGAESELVDISDAEFRFFPHAFPTKEADTLLTELRSSIPWRQDRITIHGRDLPLPRLQAWFGAGGKALQYSGITVPANPWTSKLAGIRARVETLTGQHFNGVLANCYRNGNDSVGWHSDDEPEWGRDPVIASVSFGATRDFVLKPRSNDDRRPVTIALTHGSLLLMGRGSQTHWQHQLPKRRRVDASRINLTFRNLLD